jgi:hypothetical protein
MAETARSIKMRLKTLLFLLGMLFLTTAFAGHETPDTGRQESSERPHSSGRAEAPDKSQEPETHYSCNDQGVTSSIPRRAEPNKVFDAAVVESDGHWRLARSEDLDRKKIVCSTILSDDEGVVVGRYSSGNEKSLGCRQVFSRSVFPGSLIEGIHDSSDAGFNFFGSRLKVGAGPHPPTEFVMASCGMQIDKALFALETPDGDTKFAGFQKSGVQFHPMDADRVELYAEQVLTESARESGEVGKVARECLSNFRSPDRKGHLATNPDVGFDVEENPNDSAGLASFSQMGSGATARKIPLRR